jgi:hypothetical protein
MSKKARWYFETFYTLSCQSKNPTLLSTTSSVPGGKCQKKMIIDFSITLAGLGCQKKS